MLARRLRILGCIGAAACALAALPDVAAAQAPVGKQVFATRTVAPGNILSFSVHCPPGWRVTGGTVLDNPNFMPLLRSGPNGASRWHFAFDNRRGSVFGGEYMVRVVITCMRVAVPAGGLRLRTRKAVKSGVLVPNDLRRFRVRCPGGNVPTGSGAEIEGAPQPGPRPSARSRASSLYFVGPVVIHEALPAPGGFRFLVENLLSQPIEATLIVHCIGRRAFAIRRGQVVATRRMVVRAPISTAQLQQGNNDNLRLPCPRRHLPISTGHGLAPESGVQLIEAFAHPRRGGIFSFSSPSQDAEARLAVMCLDRGQSWMPRR